VLSSHRLHRCELFTCLSQTVSILASEVDLELDTPLLQEATASSQLFADILIKPWIVRHHILRPCQEDGRKLLQHHSDNKKREITHTPVTYLHQEG
jgi:hypothetical protein